MLHLAVVHLFRFGLGQRQRRVERALRKAIRQAAAIRQRLAAPVEPAGEIDGHLPAALDVFAAARRVALAHDLRVDQPIEMERPHGVIFTLIEIIKIPAVALVVFLDHGEILLHARLVMRHAADDEAHIHQHAEERPVVFGHIAAVDLVKPRMKLLLRFFWQIKEKLLRRKRHAHAEYGHFNQPLIVIDDLAPVFRVFGIDARDNALAPRRPKRLHTRAMPREHRHNRPQRARERLHLRDIIRIYRAGIAQMQPRLVRAEQRQQRLDQLNGGTLDVRPGAKRIIPDTVSHEDQLLLLLQSAFG